MTEQPGQIEKSWGGLPKGAKPNARALAFAVLKEAEVLIQYTCTVVCNHGEECRTTQRNALHARIEALP